MKTLSGAYCHLPRPSLFVPTPFPPSLAVFPSPPPPPTGRPTMVGTDGKTFQSALLRKCIPRQFYEQSSNLKRSPRSHNCREIRYIINALVPLSALVIFRNIIFKKLLRPPPHPPELYTLTYHEIFLDNFLNILQQGCAKVREHLNIMS